MPRRREAAPIPPAQGAFFDENLAINPHFVDPFVGVKDKYGFLPTTVWDIDYADPEGRRFTRMIGDTGEIRAGGKMAATYKTSLDNQPDAVSIFNAVICSRILNSWAPREGVCYDPFGGGGTRAILSAKHGLGYVGVEIRPDEADAVRRRARRAGLSVIFDVPRHLELTPVERRGHLWLKRDDLFSVAGVKGGKARTCWYLATIAPSAGLTTAGSTHSPQVNIVAHIARALGIPCRLHIPQSSDIGPEVEEARAVGGELVTHTPGHNSVICARAREDASASGWRYIPFGMECAEAIEQTRLQVQNLPRECRRLVVPVGSGMSLAGVLWGLKDYGYTMPVVGVVVGADPEERLDKWGPPDWRQRCRLWRLETKYSAERPASVDGVEMDPVYEAKAVPFLEENDCFWVVGCRNAVGDKPAVRKIPLARHSVGYREPKAGEVNLLCGDSRYVDLIPSDSASFSITCPPYYNLEQYEGGPGDLSMLPTYGDFLAQLRPVIQHEYRILRQGSLAVWVVGILRDDSGLLIPLHHDIARLHQEAGFHVKEEVILAQRNNGAVQRVGMFDKGNRNMIRVHEYAQVFRRG